MVTDCIEKCSELVRFLMQNGGRLHGKEEYITKCRSKSVGRSRIMLCSMLDIFKSFSSLFLADEELKYEKSFGSEVLIQMEMGTLQ